MNPVDKNKIPDIHADIQVPVNDSCNCCQTVSCCFPRRARKCRKSESAPNLDRRASVYDEKAQKVLKKSDDQK